MIRKFDLASVRISFCDRGSTDVFVWPGLLASMLPAIGLNPAMYIIIPARPTLYGLTVKEIPGWDITLVGKPDHVDAVAADEDWLFRAHRTAYPVGCPVCSNDLVMMGYDCGGDKDRAWQGACVACGKTHLMRGSYVMVNPDIQQALRVARDKIQLLSVGEIVVSEANVKPEETWRDRAIRDPLL